MRDKHTQSSTVSRSGNIHSADQSCSFRCWVGLFCISGMGGCMITLAALEGSEDTWELVARGTGWPLGAVLNLTGVSCGCSCRGNCGVHESSAVCQAPCVHNATARPWPL